MPLALRLPRLPRGGRLLAALGMAALSACRTDGPIAAARMAPASIALRASVARTDATAGPAAVRITVAYLRQGGGLATLGAPQTFSLDQSSQQVPVVVDVATCLADNGRAGTGGNPAAADECNLQLTLDFLLNGVRVDQQILSNVSVKPGQRATVPDAVALAQVGDVRFVLPAANVNGGALRLELGKALTLGVQVTDANGQAITGRPVTWRSSAPAVAAVSETGVVTSVALGSAEIVAAVAGREIAVTTVVAVPSQRITLTAISTSGAGTVTSVPAGIDCRMQGAQATGTCAADFPGDATVRLTATPVASSEFMAFTGPCASVTGAVCTVQPSAPRQIGVAFRGRQPLTVTATGSGAGRVTEVNGPIACVIAAGVGTGTCSSSYAEGSTVTLSAVAGESSLFQGWAGDCASISGTTCAITMDRARAVSARFTSVALLTVQSAGTGNGTVTSSPAGLTCTINSGNTAGPCSLSVITGGTIVLTAAEGLSSRFEGWSGDCLSVQGLSCTVSMDRARTVTARFTSVAGLAVTGAGTGVGSVTSQPGTINCAIAAGNTAGICRDAFAVGTTVTLTAAPGPSSVFDGWSGDCAGSPLTCTVTLDRARTVTARFTGNATLRVSGTGTGGGTITSQPGAIACTSVTTSAGTTSSGTCSGVFSGGTVVTLTATPGAGSTFTGWSGACSGTSGCTVTMNDARDVQAEFTEIRVPLIINVTGPIGATVITSRGDRCATTGNPASCTFQVKKGETITIDGSPGAFLRFTGFGGACTGVFTCTLVMSDPRTVEATFEVKTSSLLLQLSGSGSGSVTSDARFGCTLAPSQGSANCSSSFSAGRSVRFTAVPDAGSTFAGWSGACSGTGDCFVSTNENAAVGAVFSIAQSRVRVLRDAAPGGSGLVVWGADNKRCAINTGGTSGDCTSTVTPGTTLTFRIDPSVGFPFVSWGGACASFASQATCTITVRGDVDVTARFASPP